MNNMRSLVNTLPDRYEILNNDLIDKLKVNVKVKYKNPYNSKILTGRINMIDYGTSIPYRIDNTWLRKNDIIEIVYDKVECKRRKLSCQKKLNQN